MVNFDNDTTISKPLKEIVNYVIYQRHTELIDSIADYELKKIKNYSSGLAELQSKAIGLYFDIIEMLTKDMDKERIEEDKKKEYQTPEQILEDIKGGDEEKIYKAILYMKFFIYSKGINKGDTKKNTDFTDPEIQNEDAGI